MSYCYILECFECYEWGDIETISRHSIAMRRAARHLSPLLLFRGYQRNGCSGTHICDPSTNIEAVHFGGGI